MLCSAAGATASPLQCTKLPHQNLTVFKSFRFNNNPPSTVNFYLPNKKKSSKSTIIPVNCSSSSQGLGASDQNLPYQEDQPKEEQENLGFWEKWKAKSAEMSGKMAKLGLAAVLAYGIFDGITYTTFFVLAFLGYEKSTGKNPAANIQALIGIVLLMWTGNNVTRPFRVAGAAALAPAIDTGLRKIQKSLNFPSLVYAFALVVGIVATSCLTVAGLLILSRWGK